MASEVLILLLASKCSTQLLIGGWTTYTTPRKSFGSNLQDWPTWLPMCQYPQPQVVHSFGLVTMALCILFSEWNFRDCHYDCELPLFLVFLAPPGLAWEHWMLVLIFHCRQSSPLRTKQLLSYPLSFSSWLFWLPSFSIRPLTSVLEAITDSIFKLLQRCLLWEHLNVWHRGNQPAPFWLPCWYFWVWSCFRWDCFVVGSDSEAVSGWSWIPPNKELPALQDSSLLQLTML